MIFFGSKLFGQESSLFILDTNENKIYAISSEKISGIKKDNYDISCILQDNSFKHLLDKEFTELSYSFNNFEGQDAVLETKGTSYFWLKSNYHLRRIINIKYKNQKLNYRELNILKIISKFNHIILYYYYEIIRKYYFNKYINNQLSKDFHEKYIKKYVSFLISDNKIKVKKIKFYDHHETHAYSSYYFSQVDKKKPTLVLTMDEHGDNFFSKAYIFDKNNVNQIASSKTFKYFNYKIGYAASIAGMYSNFTQAMGFERSSEEGKIEALAAFGIPNESLLNELFKIFEIDKKLSIFINKKKYIKLASFDYLISIKNKIGEKDFCASIQNFIEIFITNYVQLIHNKYKFMQICLSGGIFSNVILNNKIYENFNYENFYVFPAMTDEGTAAGAAIISALNNKANIEWLRDVNMPYFGPSYKDEDVLKTLKLNLSKIKFIKIENINKKADISANLILENKIIAIFQGKTEFGPRALGNRSILANAAFDKSAEMLNTKVKKRQIYQPFCPTILEEDRLNLFDKSFKHKYMATCFKMKKEFKKVFPCATHIDHTARPQFVEEQDNRLIFLILKNIKEKLGFGIMINTSFNLHGNTMVSNPQQAINNFLLSSMDALFLENYFVTKI